MEKKIEILPGTKMSIECGKDGGIITLYEPEKEPVFKDGDIITIHYIYGYMIAILKECLPGGLSKSYVLFNEKGQISEDESCGFWPNGAGTVAFSTEEERQRLFDALEKEGKRWNAEKKCIEEIKRHPTMYELYYFID